MPSRKLTTAAVERIRPPKEGQRDHFDQSHPGLALRVSYGGSRTWVYFYRLHGKLRRMTVGRWPGMTLGEARDAWRSAHRLVSKGESPVGQRPAAADSFAAVFEDWLKRDQGSNRTAADVRRRLERTAVSAWRDRLIGTITRRDVIEVLDAVADRGATIAARRLHAYLHRLFRWSVGRGIIEANPMADLPKPGEETKRDRVLSDAELGAVWKGADTLDWPFGLAFKLLVLTAGRRSEIGGLRWSEIEGDEIKLAGERTKNGEPHVIPLAPAAVEIIRELPHIGDGYVFTTTGETPVSGWSKAKATLDAAAADIYGRALPEWRLHDLRRTTATGLQRLGIGLQVIEAVLGHVGGSRSGVVGVYQRHAFGPEKRQALDAWAREVARIVRGESAKVVPIARRR
jgi:integrase